MRSTGVLAIVLVLASACATPPSDPHGPAFEQVPGKPQPDAAPGPEEAGAAAPAREGDIVQAGQDTSVPDAFDPSTGAAGAVTAPKDGLPVHGSLSMRYRGRSGGGDHDNDLHALLTLDVRDPHRDPWSAHILAGGALDLDDRANPSSPYFSLQDTRDDPLTGVLYEAFVQSRSVPGLAVVRLGRQSTFDLPAMVTFDGLDVESEELGPGRIRLGAYGGGLARVYSSSAAGNAVVGAFAEAVPWEGGTTRLDYMHLEDDTFLGQHNDDLAQLSLGQGFGPEWRVDGTWSRLENENRDASVRATYTELEGDFTVQAYWYRLFQAQNDLALEIDPFTDVLLEQSPYTEVRLVASKSFDEHFLLEAGADVRRVSSPEDVAEFNRDFERWYATTTFLDLLPSKIALSLTGEIWDAGSDQTSSWGVDLSREMSQKLKLSLGSYYSLYKYDLFLVSERDDVRTYYVRLRFKGGAAWAWDLRYEHEDSFDDYDSVRAGMTWSF
jgi:hypothetical protein